LDPSLTIEQPLFGKQNPGSKKGRQTEKHRRRASLAEFLAFVTRPRFLSLHAPIPQGFPKEPTCPPGNGMDDDAQNQHDHPIGSRAFFISKGIQIKVRIEISLWCSTDDRCLACWTETSNASDKLFSEILAGLDAELYYVHLVY
jgi:hypothetical protein